MEKIKGLIIIKHELIKPITNDECISALPEGLKSLDRQFISVAPESLRLNELYNAPLGQIAATQRRFFIDVIEPKLKEFPEYKILYFGLAPISLAIDLGQQFHNFRDIEVFQLHHVKKIWYQENGDENNTEFKLQSLNIPDNKQKGIGEILIRMSISHRVKAQDTQEVLSDAAEVDIELLQPNEDAISSGAQMNEIAEEFKKIMDSIAGNESSIDVVHLFGSLPTGLAFMLGTKISPTIHPFVQTYQFAATEQPKYIKAVLIKGALEDGMKLIDAQLAVAKKLRDLADDELKGNIRNFLNGNISDSKGRVWYLGIIPELEEDIMANDFWKNLVPISSTSLISDEFDHEMTSIDNGFYWAKNKWFVDDRVFLALNTRLKEIDPIKRALRLFLFHEALHYSKHKLGTNKSTDIGSFPKVLETADYQADVYGIMNEYGYTTKNSGPIVNVKEFFLQTIDVATETMWSFDDNGRDLEEIQVRRLNRYLIWYFQYVRIEQEGVDIDNIVRILAEKPVIELNGLRTKEANNRFFYDLNKRNSRYLEIAVFKNNEVTRHASGSPIPLESLVEGVKKMNGDLIKQVLRGLRDS